MNYLLKNIKTLIGVREDTHAALRGNELKNLPSIGDAWLLTEGKKIVAYGEMRTFNGAEIKSDVLEIDCSNRIVMPCFCDSHTHLVFADTREEEFVDKIKGLTYQVIAAKGGGILNSAKKLHEIPEDHLFEKSLQRLQKVISQGTGAIEIKSGYGLNYEAELKMLRVIQRLKKESPIPVKATFLGAHALPSAYTNKRAEYIHMLIYDLMPVITENNLADYCDVFCENGFFSVEETEEILEAASKYNLKPKIHVNQLNSIGGVKAGVRHHALSVDHLETMSDEDIDCLKNSSTIGTLLPSAAFFLRMNYPPARKLIDENAAIALASDYNPGSSPSGRMSFVLSLACIQMKMLPEEAINASTLNGACAMELQHELGSVTVGKTANLIITKPIHSIANIPYSFGEDLIENVLIASEITYGNKS